MTKVNEYLYRRKVIRYVFADALTMVLPLKLLLDVEGLFKTIKVQRGFDYTNN